MSQPHLVGHEQEHGSGKRPIPQPPYALGEARAVGGESLPDDGDGPSAGKRYGGVHGHRPVQPQPYGVGDIRDGGGQAVDDGEGVDALGEDAQPLHGEGTGAKRLSQVHPFLLDQRPDACGGQVEPARRRDEVRRVGRQAASPVSSSFPTPS